jgi:hypothetical protein
VTAALDKAQFYPGEALNYHIIAENPTTDPITLRFNTSGQAHIILDGGPPQVNGISQILTQRTIPAQSSHTWTIAHNWRSTNLSIGSHEYIGGVVGYGNAAPILFDVVPPVFPTEGFTIDFETLPDSSSVPMSITEYWPFGVRFATQTSSSQARPTIGTAAENRYLTINSTTYPPGFNILAEFDIPVHALAADVSGSVGTQVTMVALDALGQVLDTAVSAPTPSGGGFLPVSVESISPIASVQWWSNPMNSSIRVDNLAITLPEPGVLAQVAMLGVLLSRRRVRHTCH